MEIKAPVVTVKEARKILGVDAQKLTDVEIEKLIDDLDLIVRYAIKQFKEFDKPLEFFSS